MKKQFHLTPDGVAELKAELEQLVAQRGEIAEKIKSAREFGDLTENAEYATARQEQERSENRISEIEHILQNVEIIKKPKGDSKVVLGSEVKLKSNDGKSKTYSVVGTVGESVDIVTPVETITYKVVSIA